MLNQEARKAGTEKTAWISVNDLLPPECVEVETKIDDERGCRNEQTLQLMRGLWWLGDLSMYVYYTPTHWRSK